LNILKNGGGSALEGSLNTKLQVNILFCAGGILPTAINVQKLTHIQEYSLKYYL
jgi:hypothetical protein